MNRKIIVTAIILFSLVVLAGCAATSPDKSPNYKNMTVDELNNQLKNKDFVLVDVHIPEQKHINGTDVFIPYNEIENHLDKLPKNKDAKIILYCRTGHMSQIAAEKLAEKGYANVYNVVGGKVAWDAKGINK